MQMTVNNFGEFKRKLRSGMNNSLSIAGLYISGRIRIGTPVRTGRLKGSIDYRVVNETELQTGTNVDYAIDVHEGTRRQRPQRFIYNPIIQEISTLRNIIVEGIRNYVS